ncbi:MAG TPA: alanine racemase [Solirubrobacteraceae bacterium]|nr:alanine racemase [Solirubrobacteraceae bacterium]
MADTLTGSAAPAGTGALRRAEASVNLAALERNCERMRRELRDGAMLCAVVKADGYGHGALPSARAALAGGASWLAVADAREAVELREGGLSGVPILVMGALAASELEQALGAGADVVVWREDQLHAVIDAGGGRVHVKLDSGMGRLGTREPSQAASVVAAARSAPGVVLAGLMTHFATADEQDDEGFFEQQLHAFTSWTAPLKREQPELIVHAANSAAVLRRPEAHFDMVRCGISIYGMDPFGVDARERELDPVLELSSYVAEVKPCRAGQSAGYGRTFRASGDTAIGLLPIGYGDGWRRALSNNGEVLIAGRRYPLAGTVSMDSITVDLGADAHDTSLRGRRAVLLGSDGSERISAEDVARRLGTINYEITCGLTRRVPRTYHRDGTAVAEPLAG